jgi:hypothetical protein
MDYKYNGIFHNMVIEVTVGEDNIIYRFTKKPNDIWVNVFKQDFEDEDKFDLIDEETTVNINNTFKEFELFCLDYIYNNITNSNNEE